MSALGIAARRRHVGAHRRSRLASAALGGGVVRIGAHRAVIGVKLIGVSIAHRK